MIDYLEQKHKDSFSQSLAIAIVVHVAIFLSFFVVSYLFNLKIFSPKKIKIIESSVRVDVVAMPKFTVQELKKMKVASQAKAEEVEVNTKNESVKNSDSKDSFKKVSKKKVDLKNLLKNLSLKKTVTKKKVKKIRKNNKLKDMVAQNSQLKSLVLEGNKVSKGTSYVGNAAKEKVEFHAYIGSLPSAIRPNWKLPSYLIEQNLQCRLRIFIGARGEILKIEIYETSGVEEYDNKAIQAVKQSAPLPPPGSDILGKLASGEVILGFPL